MARSNNDPNPIYAGKPSDTLSMRAAYEVWTGGQTEDVSLMTEVPSDKKPKKVGIIGAGVAGLYAALVLLRQPEIELVRVFEAEPERVGGRVYTHHFKDKHGNPEDNQYFDAGAMRLPSMHYALFSLIDYLNNRTEQDQNIERIEYTLFSKGNRVFVNGKYESEDSKVVMTRDYANLHRKDLGFDLDEEDYKKSAEELLEEVIRSHVDRLKEGDREEDREQFEENVRKLYEEFDDYSMRAYLSQVECWSEAKINYVEVMTSATNAFSNSFIEMVIDSYEFSDDGGWRTIAGGVGRLPAAMASLIDDHIEMGASVYKLEEVLDDKGGIVSINVHYNKDGSKECENFDAVIAAVSPAVIRMWETPQWPAEATHPLRALGFESIYKIGMQFKSRFWEKEGDKEHPGSFGGQSTTDLPSRWCVYPSYKFKSTKGVLLLYSWMADAQRMLPHSDEELEALAIRDLAALYPEVEEAEGIENLLIQSHSVSWTMESSQGIAKFLPGQFKHLFEHAREAQSDCRVFFAGEHLSVEHGWIEGAIDSALYACGLMGYKSEALRDPDSPEPAPHTYDYSSFAVPAGQRQKEPAEAPA